MLIAIALVPAFLLVALSVRSGGLAWTSALALGAFFGARYILMRRGVS